jgi:YQGE family putative transporter
MPNPSQTKDRGHLDGQTRLLLVVNVLFAGANALSGAFLNVYLWKAKPDLATIGWFALSHQIVMATVFIVAGKWVKEHNKMHALRLGVMLAAAFYFLVLYLGTKSADVVVWLGGVQGVSSALFWLAFNVVYFEVTERGNRDVFNGWSGLLGSGAGMVAPWLSGILITRMEDLSGYRLIFSISLGLFVSGAITSFFLKRRPVQPHYTWLYGIHKLREHGNPWRRVFPALVAQGVREGVFTFLIGLMVFIATRKEMQLGNYAFITSAVSLAAFFIAGKLLKPEHRSLSMAFGAAAMTIVIVPFFWQVNYTTLLLFGIVVAFVYPLYSIPITSAVFDLIGTNQESASHRVEYVVLRETALNSGRIMGTIAFLVVVSLSSAPSAMVTLMLVIGSAPVFAWVFMRKFLATVK